MEVLTEQGQLDGVTKYSGQEGPFTTNFKL